MFKWLQDLITPSDEDKKFFKLLQHPDNSDLRVVGRGTLINNSSKIRQSKEYKRLSKLIKPLINQS